MVWHGTLICLSYKQNNGIGRFDHPEGSATPQNLNPVFSPPFCFSFFWLHENMFSFVSFIRFIMPHSALMHHSVS
jgi:hypothetical protein